MQNLPKIGLPIIFIIGAIIILISKTAVTIGPGEGGVLFERFGDGIDTEQTYGEGFHVVAPWNSMLIHKVRQQSISDEMNVLSVNGLEVKVNGTIWYEPEYENLGSLIKTKGEDYVNELLSPAVNAAARSVVGRYTPEQLYSSKRDVIEQEILDEVVTLLKGQFLNVKRVLVEDVKLPNTIKNAIESKLKQEQESLEYEFRLVTADKEAQKVQGILQKIKGALEQSKNVRSLDLTEKEREEVVDVLHLLTDKPVLYVCNVSEDAAAKGNNYVKKVQEFNADEQAEVLVLAISVEADINELDTYEERQLFLDDLGLEEPGAAKLIRKAYQLLKQQTYFTAGEKEVRAWTINIGSTAPQAAGVIHTDFEKGFIRAEVISYEDYLTFKTEAKAKVAGRMRVEGKEYSVIDGDVMHFRFNV